MIRFAEYVSPGHPDKVADYISQYLLDRYIEHDPLTRYAVEVQIKDNHVVLGGEVNGRHVYTEDEIRAFVRDAVCEIGYTRNYAHKWGKENTISSDRLDIDIHIGQQSRDIAQGLSGWGDQGIFFGYANTEPDGMPYEHTAAKRLCKALFDSGLGGLDIKTQVVTNDAVITKVIAAIPLLNDADTEVVKAFVRRQVRGDYELIVNGTGRYVKHSSVADCGTTGRKLAVDFYGGACRIGGGAPWTKDASKADLTLNLYARELAKAYAAENDCEVYTSLACCIGKQEVEAVVQDGAGNVFAEGVLKIDPRVLHNRYRLYAPIFASMCRWGLFGEYQQDKAWEQPQRAGMYNL